MSETVWIRRDVIDAMHDMQLVKGGGAAGIRDQRLLDSALAKPRNKHASGTIDEAAFADWLRENTVPGKSSAALPLISFERNPPRRFIRPAVMPSTKARAPRNGLPAPPLRAVLTVPPAKAGCAALSRLWFFEGHRAE